MLKHREKHKNQRIFAAAAAAADKNVCSEKCSTDYQ